MPRKQVRERRRQQANEKAEPEALMGQELLKRTEEELLRVMAEGHRQKLKALFRALCYVLVTILGLFLVSKYGITHPFFVSLLFSFVAYVVALALHMRYIIFGSQANFSEVKQGAGLFSAFCFFFVYLLAYQLGHTQQGSEITPRIT
eukprot:gb/GEZN01023307.1/.p1 GENE.gb/GEZN01023307.1/~~gb/GEZN01023307.1/.p1  ORF type:complete len:147 (+),score=21.30 gb/GEZN01023307.1/:19-459(+)